ncbi:probable 3',5'-cyclic phosphodiesterase pde-5 isoform X3 [Actinia tenebrosa]|uniref:Probable 3',5'-cyclic phosphodiesterase pde-5 isoform X3 n=1 Tax=Actinia tenebrosa TaxID=6105 RepID=A0A6P8H2X4_ACTTE|nr:probable 3',5'-cyclic phosphodiesterase pde-5 isoform X3 [Actinia tenebrosa]
MSSPSRQISNRRLPPLPNSSRSSPIRRITSGGSVKTTSACSTNSRHGPTSNHQGSQVNNHGHYDLNVPFSDGPFRPALIQGKAIGERPNPETHEVQLDGENVRSYLVANPMFLDEFVMKHVDQDRLERWLIRKTRKLKQKGRHPPGDQENSKQNGPLSHRPSLSKWKFCVHSDKKKMLEELTHDIHTQPNKQKVLLELANCIASACHADGFVLYLVDSNGQDLYIHNPSLPEGKTSSPIKIQPKSTIAAYVAHALKPVRTNDILGDERFPQGTGVDGTTAQSVLCQPIVQSNGDLIGTIELTRTVGRDPFDEEDEEIVNSYLVWGGISLYYAEMYHHMHKHRKLTEFLLNVTRSIFQDIVSMDTVIMKIMNYAQTLVDADRTSLFLVDNKTSELYARIFDIGGSLEDSKSSKLQKEIRFPKTKGVAGYVATTGETLNITDAYHDERFNREIDIQTGYTTRTLLCMPIFIRGSIIGVVQMVNKKSGVFTASDEKSFQTFAIYCGLALHHAKLYDKIRRSEQKHRVALEVLSYHSKCSEKELRSLKELQTVDPYPELESYDFDSYSLESEVMPKLVIDMTRNLFSLTRFDVDELYRFVLTVRKNYRRVPYHNWTHAFAVAHCMYLVIRSGHNNFSGLEALAMFFACLCHDLDHRGRTNSWMKNEGTPLAAVYSTSTMEHHHFNQTITILQHEGHNIFSHLSSTEYKSVLGFMKECILATDLALFFGNKAKLKDFVEKGTFSWEDQEHRRLLRAICMTACDLSACTKPWDIQYQIVKVIYQEFYAEGDLEKAQGKQPIPMKDRNTAHELPAHQVGFLVGICLPCYELLAKIIPGTKNLVLGGKKNLKLWSERVAKQKEIMKNEEKSEEERKKSESENNEKSPTPSADDDEKQTKEEKDSNEENERRGGEKKQNPKEPEDSHKKEESIENHKIEHENDAVLKNRKTPESTPSSQATLNNNEVKRESENMKVEKKSSR